MNQTGKLTRQTVNTLIGYYGSWRTSGNSTLGSNNFLGTIDKVDLRFKTNNFFSGIISYDTTKYTIPSSPTANVYLGSLAGNASYPSGTASYNVVIGTQAGQNISSSSNNVVIGFEAAQNLQSQGGGNVIIGSQAAISASNTPNTGLTEGTNNVIIGLQAGKNMSFKDSYNTYLNSVGINFGDNNIVIGYNNIDPSLSASGCVLIGNNINYSAAATLLDNTINIGNIVYANGASSTDPDNPIGSVGIGQSVLNPNITLEVGKLNPISAVFDTFVGIGVSNPQAYLEVAGSSNTYNWSGVGNIKGFNPDATDINSPASDGGATNPVAAIFNGTVILQNTTGLASFITTNNSVTSDIRLKNIKDTSNGVQDLETLNKIKIIDYKMKDSIINNKIYKKVIAQQIAEVYPNALADSFSGFIPNVYAVAQSVKMISKKQYEITMSPNIHFDHLAKEVRLYNDQGHVVDAKIDKIVSSTKCIVSVNDPLTQKVFVFGTRVNNIKTVDYDAISMLNVSATQELYKRMQQQDKKIEAQAQQIKELYKIVNQLIKKTKTK